jgi:hypothetical protein
MKPEIKIKKARKIREDIWRLTEDDELQWELNKATDAMSIYIKEVEASMPAKCERAIVKAVRKKGKSKKQIVTINLGKVKFKALM